MTWMTGTSLGGIYNTFHNYWYPPVNAPENKSKLYVEPSKIDSVEPTKTVSLPSREDLISYSLKAFDCYEKVWDFDNFWKRANTFDACISLSEALLMTKKPHDPEVDKILDKVQAMLTQNIEYYKTYDHDDEWADDFGWWGLMGLNAYKLLKKLGNEKLAKGYFDLSYNCWSYMKKNAYDASGDSKPVAHGCRNNSVNDLPTDGAKNTVVNASLLLLSTRLYQFSAELNLPDLDRKPFLDMAYSQWVWFSKWFENTDKDYEYLKLFKDNAALAGERPIATDCVSQKTSSASLKKSPSKLVGEKSLDAYPDYHNPYHPSWSKGWVWTGDHGLLIGGLLDLLILKDHLTGDINPNFHKEVREIAQKLVRGVQEAMIGSGDGLFHEPPCLSSYSSYPIEYLGGRGILVRYMGVQDIKDLLGIDFDFTKNILQTITALWSTRDNASNQFQPEFASDQQNKDYFTQYKNLVGYADNDLSWGIDSADPKTLNGISQAVGLDFLGVALSSKKIQKNEHLTHPI